MKSTIRVYSGLVLLLALSSYDDARASALYDRSYALRSFVALVLNVDTEPVYGDHVEQETIKFFKSQSRFEFSDQGYAWFKERLKTLRFTENAPLADKVKALRPQIEEMAPLGVDGVLITEIFPSEEKYRIAMAMVSTTGGDFLRLRDVYVDDRFSLESFTSNVVQGLWDLVKTIPFDGTVLRRDGYRVVLDRGGQDVTTGSRLSVFSMEMRDGKFFLEETGEVEIVEVGDSYSFGRILVEKKPLEVSPLNKILFNAQEGGRQLAGAVITNSRNSKREIGYARVDLGMHIVNVSNRSTSGAGASAGQMYPGGALFGELWISGRWYADAQMHFLMGSLSPAGQSSLGSSVNDMRAHIGYRLALSRPNSGPNMHFRMGFARHAFSVDTSPETVPLNNITYSGITLGGGATLTLTEKIGFGFDIDAIAMGGASESPLTSGNDVNSLSAWEFAVHGYYHFSDVIDIIAQLQFHNYSSEFDGQGTRPVPMTSASQSARALVVGMAYYF